MSVVCLSGSVLMRSLIVLFVSVFEFLYVVMSEMDLVSSCMLW